MKNNLIKIVVVAFTWGCMMATGSAQSTYSVSTSSSGIWSNTAIWSPTPSTGGPGALDTANINNLTYSSIITYDAAASGSIGILNMNQTTYNAQTTLSLSRSLTINTYASILTSNGNETINIGVNNLTIASGATLMMGTTSALALTSHATITGSGTVVINGTLNVASNNTATTNSPLGAYINSNVVMGAGSVIDVDTQTGAASSILYITGNFDSSAGGTLMTSGSSSTKSMIYFQGSNIIIGSGGVTGFLTGSGINAAGSGGIMFNTNNTTASQTISVGSVFDMGMRAMVAGTSSANAVTTKYLSSTATSGTISNAIGQIDMDVNLNYTTLNLVFQSDLNPTKSTAFYFSMGTTNSVAIIDLNGYSFNTGGVNAAFVPSSIAGANQLDIINSGASSIANNKGVFQDSSFNFSASDTVIGSGVILKATGTGVTNDLGGPATGTGTVNATSTFYYTGAGTASLSSTNNRSLGAIVIGTGTSASTLKLGTAITTQNNVTVNPTATLDLNNKALTLGANNLIGSGTVSSSVSGGSISFTTGGLAPGGDASISALTINSGVTLNLGVAGTSQSASIFDVASDSSYDQILGNGTININDAILTINLLSGFSISGSTQLTLFSSTTTLVGTFSNVTLTGVDAANYTATFDNGILTIIPEPSSIALLCSALLLCMVVKCKRLSADKFTS